MAAVQVQASPASRRIDAVRQMRAGVQAMSALIREGDIETLGVALIQIRESGIDPLEAVFAEGVRLLDKSGEYHADGALSVVDWLRSSCKLSGGAAAERGGIASKIEKLPQTEAAFASGALGYQHVVVMARAAEHVGATAVRKEEARLLQAARTMDPGRSPGWPRTSSTGSTPPAPWPRPTGRISDGISTLANPRMAWSGSMACSTTKAAQPCG